MFYEVEWFKEEVDEFWKERMNKFFLKKESKTGRVGGKNEGIKKGGEKK